MSVFRHFERNFVGRDFAVGDIHGHFTRLQAALDAAGFVAESDRLFSVGDLVDRGPESIRALEWLDRPWFFAIQGNHEDMAVRHAFEHSLDPDVYCSNGGAWFMALPDFEQRRIAARLGSLPLLAEIDTEYGPVGLVHADCPLASWTDLCEVMTSPDVPRRLRERLKVVCQWSRERIYAADERGVAGVRAVIVGHTPVRQVAALGNVYHIDTGGWLEAGHFTLLDLHTLQAG
ncbi:metallophosphoesterase [Pseudomonas schmalbachii]|uniref:Metallophosphoesterase n=1 Tax=Pseudomonas schmalbachii TaxID=2816993 RepID=A0ABS3TTL2_9PSED|nr:metallophosphoesterase [Pseudomonas schmalbachii]MBO3277012.1 metallophosphoesterase [Pseudomonas schmalbachii]